MLFTDELHFTVEETFNKQKIEFMHGHPRKSANWCQGSNEVIILFSEECPMMTSLLYIFVKKALKQPLNQTMFQIKTWIFQQDPAPAQKAKTTQQLLENHVSEFISRDHWPSASPNRYPLWSVLEGIDCTRRHHNLESESTLSLLN